MVETLSKQNVDSRMTSSTASWKAMGSSFSNNLDNVGAAVEIHASHL